MVYCRYICMYSEVFYIMTYIVAYIVDGFQMPLRGLKTRILSNPLDKGHDHDL